MSDRRVMSQYHSLVKILIFSMPFLRPRQSGAHGTCHACHTRDTPLVTGKSEMFYVSEHPWFLYLFYDHIWESGA